ncbi:MAG: ABC transporter ATP-binding protein [Verrucomicrobia bacterium]|nr:ABC transporter ATP-binding protein [Verrucomicrobiota bacterium]
MATSPIIKFENVSRSFGIGPVLENVSFEIAPGESTCLIGPNGGGKTTLLRLMLGLIKPDCGKVEIFGSRPSRARRKMAYVPQHIRFDPLFPVNALDIVLMGRLNHLRFGRFCDDCKSTAYECLADVGLADAAHRPFADLSGGQRQRVLIARALACKPDLLLLDEPTANIDLSVEARLLDTFAELRKRMSIIMVSHDLDLISHITDDYVLCVHQHVHRHPVDDLSGDVIREIYSSERRVEHERKTLHGQGDHSHCDHS